MNPDDFDVIDRPEPDHDVADPPRRQGKRIAAGEDHLPDLRPRRDIGERGVQRLRGEIGRTARPDHGAAKAEAAVDRAAVEKLQQRAIGIAVNDPLDRAERRIADRVFALLRARKQFGQIGDELARDRVARIRAIDQPGDRRRNADGVALRDRLDLGPPRRRRKTRVDEVGGGAQG